MPKSPTCTQALNGIDATELALIINLHTDKGSSADETRPDSAGGEDETIMEPEQGSGE